MTGNLFRFSATLDVRWRDLDAMGHANNAVYPTCMEQGRVLYMRELGLGFRSPDDVDMILAEVSCAYHSALSLGEQVTVCLRACDLRNSSLAFEYRIEGEGGGLAATARSVQVFYDYEADRPLPIPGGWGAVIAAFEPGFAGER